jgi:2'-5' RNA ligase
VTGPGNATAAETATAVGTVRLVIIAVPPQPLFDRLTLLRRRLCQLGRSRAALAYPVHLTLRTGALVPEEQLPYFFREFADCARNVPAFPVSLGRFVASGLPDSGQEGGGKCFAGFEVVSGRGLMAAHRQLSAFELWRKGLQYEYRPHLTMAFDDLDEAGLDCIRAEMAGREDEYEGTMWMAEQVMCCRKRGEAWVEAALLPLRKEI